MKTKVNEVPLVGPRGRKELLKRIEELETQIAQQNYLVIETPDTFDMVAVWPLSFFEKIEEKFKANLLYNIILVDNNVPDNPEGARILSHTMNGGVLGSISFTYDSSVVVFQRPEE